MSSRVSKITPSSIGCKPAMAKIDEKEVECALIFGEASGLAIKGLPTGDQFTALTGVFEATNLHTGEVFNSGVLFLPGGLHEAVVAAIDKEENMTVKFGILLVAVPAKNPAGYSWVGRDVVDLQQEDPLAELKASMIPTARKMLLEKHGAKLQLPDLSKIQRAQPGEVIDLESEEIETLNPDQETTKKVARRK